MRITFLTRMIFALALIINLCYTYAQYGNSQRYESVAEIVANKVLVDYEEEYKFMFRGRYLTVFYNNDSNTEIFNLYAADKGELKYRSTSNNGTASVYSNWNNDGYGNIYYETPVSINVNSDNIWFNGTADIGRMETESSREITERTRQNNYTKPKTTVSSEKKVSNEGVNEWVVDEEEYFEGFARYTYPVFHGNQMELNIAYKEWENEPLRLQLHFKWTNEVYDQTNPEIHFYFDNQESIYLAKEIYGGRPETTLDSEDFANIKTAVLKSQPDIELGLIEILDLFKKSNNVTFEVKMASGKISKYKYSLRGSSKAINTTIPGHTEMVEKIKAEKSEENAIKEEKENSKPWWKFWDY